MKISNIEIFFSKLFSPIILKNLIVSTILYNISKQLAQFKIKIDNTLNNDI
jgi:hypothetical protein